VIAVGATPAPWPQTITELTVPSSVRLEVPVTNSVTLPRTRTTSPAATAVAPGAKTKMPSEVAGLSSASGSWT
jgi:hypothetical protein